MRSRVLYTPPVTPWELVIPEASDLTEHSTLQRFGGAKMFYVYVLTMNNGEIYIGFSTNLKNRIKQHYENKVISTKNREPKLVYYEAYMS